MFVFSACFLSEKYSNRRINYKTSAMVHIFLLARGLSELVRLQCLPEYIRTLEHFLVPILGQNHKPNAAFQNDNVVIHSWHAIKRFLQTHGVKAMICLPLSNPIKFYRVLSVTKHTWIGRPVR